MSYPGTQLGGRPLNSHHPPSSDIEAEYDRLRGAARNEANLRSAAFSKSHDAYSRGDGAGAHNFSEEGKSHGAQMESFNKQASELIFRENNAPGRIGPNEIDLHGQFVEEAEDILEERIKAGQARGEPVLHVIVGKGIHSVDHIQKIKPRVEKVCREQGLQFGTEENEGRLWVNLGGGGGGQQQQQQPQGQFQPPQGAPPVGMAGGQWNQHQQHQPPQGPPPPQQQGGAAQGYYGGGGQGQFQPPQGPPPPGGQGQYQPPQGGPPPQQYGGQQQHQQQQQQHQGGGGGGGNAQNEQLEALAKKFLPKILKKLERECCVVM